jgi:flagellar biogenesis protein FliO
MVVPDLATRLLEDGAMKWNPRWLLLPPAAALLIVLGPLTMQGERGKNGSATPPVSTPASSPAATPAATNAANPESGAANTESASRVPAPPRTPDMWQVVSTLLGLLVLGGVGIFALRRLRQGPRGGTASVLHLRQTLRLSARQAVHVVEFDDRLLLVGEGDRGVHLLHSGRLPEPAADEAEVTARTIAESADDEGATPKDLLIPRPAVPPAARTPTAPAVRAAARGLGLTDFRALLQKAGKA